MEFGIVFQNWVASNALELFSLFIASIALLYAARAFHLTKRTWKATQHSETSEIRLRAKTALADADRSLEVLRNRCHDIQSQWDAHDRKHNFMTFGDSFHKDPEIINNSKVQQQGMMMLASLKDSFSDLDELTRTELALLHRSALG
jgi:hypothetical protein